MTYMFYVLFVVSLSLIIDTLDFWFLNTIPIVMEIHKYHFHITFSCTKHATSCKITILFETEIFR